MNNKNRSNLKDSSEKGVMLSSSTAGKVGDFDYMVVDDEPEYSSNSEDEYKEPWVRYGSLFSLQCLCRMNIVTLI